MRETRVGSPAARISSMSSCARPASRSPRSRRRIPAGLASNCSTRPHARHKDARYGASAGRRHGWTPARVPEAAGEAMATCA